MKSDKKAYGFNRGMNCRYACAIDLKNTLKLRKVSEVKRTNTFIIEDCPALWELADVCARLYNELNFERRWR